MPDADAVSSPGRPGPDAADDDASYTRIARQLVRDGARVIGFLTVTSRRHPVALTALLTRLSQSVTGFVEGDVAFIPGWNEWKPLPRGEGDDAGPRMTVREVRPRVVEVMPAAAANALSAAQALEHALKVLPESFAHVMVDLDGYAPGGRAPSTVGLVEAVVLLVRARRARLRDVDALTDQIPSSKQMGAVLLG